MAGGSTRRTRPRNSISSRTACNMAVTHPRRSDAAAGANGAKLAARVARTKTTLNAATKSPTATPVPARRRSSLIPPFRSSSSLVQRTPSFPAPTSETTARAAAAPRAFWRRSMPTSSCPAYVMSPPSVATADARSERRGSRPKTSTSRRLRARASRRPRRCRRPTRRGRRPWRSSRARRARRRSRPRSPGRGAPRCEEPRARAPSS